MQTTRFAIAALAAALWLPATAQADQFQWLAARDAERAQAAIAEVGLIRHFCAPCNDTVSRAERIDAVEIGPVPDNSEYWQVYVNGAPVDLAYVYVPRDGAWRNLSMLMQMEGADEPSPLQRKHLLPDPEADYGD